MVCAPSAKRCSKPRLIREFELELEAERDFVEALRGVDARSRALVGERPCVTGGHEEQFEAMIDQRPASEDLRPVVPLLFNAIVVSK